METLLTLLMPILLFGSSLLGFTSDVPDSKQVVADRVPQSVELGLREMSPNGEEGGFAIPASGCSSTDLYYGDGTHPVPNATNCPNNIPIITAVPAIIRAGDSTLISWDPKQGLSCSLSLTVTKLNGNAVVNPDAIGSSSDYPTAQTKYTIRCHNGNAEAIVKVLPVIQET